MLSEEARYARLKELAEQDATYQMWKRSYEDCVCTFREFADNQPDEICNILWGYAECGRFMQQRIVNIACTYMDFLETEEKGAD